MTVRYLDFLFLPASVAVIGASERPGSVGSVLLQNLKHGGFKGPIWPVNLRHDRIDGAPAWRDVQSLPAAPDLAVICTPAASVPDLIAELGRKGAHAAIVISSGLRQAGATGASSLEQQMLALERSPCARPGDAQWLGRDAFRPSGQAGGQRAGAGRHAGQAIAIGL